ncbi:STM3941 family protein [Luteimonas sp. SDU101]
MQAPGTPEPRAIEVLRPSPVRWLVTAAICAAFVWAGSAIMPSHPLLAWACIAFFGLGVLVALANLLPGASGLVLDAEGFEIVSLYRRSRIAWADVARFGEVGVGLERMVGFDFAEGARSQARMHRINRRVSGFHGALPDRYRLGAAELVQRLEHYRQDWHARHPGAPARLT